MTIIINPKYEVLRSWIEQLPQLFYTQGDIIYDARNQIRIMRTPNQLEVCVKRYHQPRWINRIVYTFFRTPKSTRAYTNAKHLNDLDIPTPLPIAEIRIYRQHLLAESYLITEKSPLQRRFYEFREHGTKGYEHIIRQLGEFAANMHEKQVLHKDFSPGNILFDVQDDGVVQFQIVDINRMRFDHPIDVNTAAKNFCRLWGEEDFFHILSQHYAKARQWNTELFTKRVIHYWKQFWKHRK